MSDVGLVSPENVVVESHSTHVNYNASKCERDPHSQTFCLYWYV